MEEEDQENMVRIDLLGYFEKFSGSCNWKQRVVENICQDKPVENFGKVIVQNLEYLSIEHSQMNEASLRIGASAR